MTGKEWDEAIIKHLKTLKEYVDDAESGFMTMINKEGMESDTGMVDFTERIFEDIPALIEEIKKVWDADVDL